MGPAALATLIFYAMSFVPVLILSQVFDAENGFTVFLVYLYIFLVTGPLMLGGALFVISVFRKGETSVAEVFYGFERYGKATGLYLLMTLFTILWACLLIVPGYIAAIRYSMSFFILADHPEIGVMQAMNESKRLMRGNVGKFFCLYLSFIGWMILGSITIIGDLFVMPYVYVTMVAFYDIANGSLRAVNNNVNLIQGESLINTAAEGGQRRPDHGLQRRAFCKGI